MNFIQDIAIRITFINEDHLKKKTKKKIMRTISKKRKRELGFIKAV